MKAFAYLRVSSQGQVSGDGFDRQREAIRSYAAAAGIEIAGWYEESGVSGTIETTDRPAWNAMLATEPGRCWWSGWTGWRGI
jgi:site-specific DNA recombinase